MKFLLIALFAVTMTSTINFNKDNLSGGVRVVCDVESCDTNHDF